MTFPWNCGWFLEATHRIHGTGIFTYIYHRNHPNVGRYTIHGSYGLEKAFQMVHMLTLKGIPFSNPPLNGWELFGAGDKMVMPKASQKHGKDK